MLRIITVLFTALHKAVSSGITYVKDEVIRWHYNRVREVERRIDDQINAELDEAMRQGVVYGIPDPTYHEAIVEESKELGNAPYYLN